jgi:hypothetical protein
VETWTVSEIDRLDLFDEVGDTPAQLTVKLVARDKLREDNIMKNTPAEDTLTREILGTLNHKLFGTFREACKRKTHVMPQSIDDLVEMATDYGFGPSTGMTLVDTPGREPRKASAAVHVALYEKSCYNCGAKDHYRPKCPHPPKDGGAWPRE